MVVCMSLAAGGHFNIKYDVNVPLFTYWLHDAEFKELDELVKEGRLHGLGANETDPRRYPLERKVP